MPVKTSLATAALIALSVSTATACDDYAEEQALAAAQQAAKMAAQSVAETQSAAPVASTQTEAVGVASADVKVDTGSVAPTVRR